MEEQVLPRLAVLASGSGSLFEAILKDGLPIRFMLADRECKALKIAEEYGIKKRLLPRRGTFKPGTGVDEDRKAYTKEVATALGQMGIDLVIMAGFMAVFGPLIFAIYENRILNSHPSLLPAFKGERAVQDAIDYGVKVTGTTIHVATPELDSGPILSQEAVPVFAGDTRDILWERIKVVERRLYPETIRAYMKTLPATTSNAYENTYGRST